MRVKRNWIALPFFIALAACGGDAEDSRIVGELASDRIELTAEMAEPIIEILPGYEVISK